LIINESGKSLSQQGGIGREAHGLQKLNKIGIVTIKTTEIKHLYQ
jgi:hypothetical protein